MGGAPGLMFVTYLKTQRRRFFHELSCLFLFYMSSFRHSQTNITFMDLLVCMCSRAACWISNELTAGFLILTGDACVELPVSLTAHGPDLAQTAAVEETAPDSEREREREDKEENYKWNIINN